MIDKRLYHNGSVLCDVSISGIYEDVYNDDTLLLIANEYFGIEKTA